MKQHKLFISDLFSFSLFCLIFFNGKYSTTAVFVIVNSSLAYIVINKLYNSKRDIAIIAATFILLLGFQLFFTITFEKITFQLLPFSFLLCLYYMLSDILTKEIIKSLIKEIPRHSPISYKKKNGFTPEFFEVISKEALSPYIYILISNTLSPANIVLSKFTNKTFNHVSVAFDRELKTLISYNGGEEYNDQPGLNQERLSHLLKNKNSEAYLYRYKVTNEQKEKMLEMITRIDREGSSYNSIMFIRRKPLKPNIMFCSQFLYLLLDHSGASYFQNPAEYVEPSDFVEQDYKRVLKFIDSYEHLDYYKE